MHAVALDDLTHVHKFAEQAGGAGRRTTEHDIAGFRGSQMVADRANAADTGGNLLHFGYKPSLTELFEAAEFVDMEISMLNVALQVKVDGHFSVTFDPGDWFNRNFLCNHSYLLVPIVEFAVDFGHSALG